MVLFRERAGLAFGKYESSSKWGDKDEFGYFNVDEITSRLRDIPDFRITSGFM